MRGMTDREAEAYGEDRRDGVLEPDDSADQGAHDYEQQWYRQGEGW